MPNSPDFIDTPIAGVFDAEFAKNLMEEVRKGLPEEKMKEQLRMFENARVMKATGAIQMNGLGQRIGIVPMRTYMRWQQEHPGCWQDEGFIKKMLKDNPELACQTNKQK